MGLLPLVFMGHTATRSRLQSSEEEVFKPLSVWVQGREGGEKCWNLRFTSSSKCKITVFENVSVPTWLNKTTCTTLLQPKTGKSFRGFSDVGHRFLLVLSRTCRQGSIIQIVPCYLFCVDKVHSCGKKQTPYRMMPSAPNTRILQTLRFSIKGKYLFDLMLIPLPPPVPALCSSPGVYAPCRLSGSPLLSDPRSVVVSFCLVY